MKNLFLGALTLLFLGVVSCKKTAENAEETVETAIETAGENIEEKAQEVAETIESKIDTAIPSFENPAVEEYLNSYEAYIEKYKEAAMSKDMGLAASLSEEGQVLAQKAQEIASTLSPEDTQKWTEYMSAKSKELQELAQSMTQQ